MKCYNCGHLLPDDSEFCQYCGKRIKKETPLQNNVGEFSAAEEMTETTELVWHNLHKPTAREKVNIIFKENKEKRKQKIRFCKMCGSQIDVTTKQCTGCGKQYFNGIKFNKFSITVLVLSFVILISVILNIVQQIKINSLNEEIDFYDNHVVFVVDDGTELYHKYDCPKFKGVFRAYNVEAAKEKGYKECPKCH